MARSGSPAERSRRHRPSGEARAAVRTASARSTGLKSPGPKRPAKGRKAGSGLAVGQGPDVIDRFRRSQALARLVRLHPQLGLQALRLAKLLEIQRGIPSQQFPPGSCFLHANLVTTASFAVKQVSEIDLATCQVTIEIHGDEELAQGMVVLPLEAIEWFGFPSTAVTVGIRFSGFTSALPKDVDAIHRVAPDQSADAPTDQQVRPRGA